MIKIKLLEIKETNEISGLRYYPEFVKALQNVVDYKIEIVSEPEAFFEGYYLIPV